jgi:hypothetical protein
MSSPLNAEESGAAPPRISEETRDDFSWESLIETATSELGHELFKIAEDFVIWNYWPLPEDR